MGHSTHSTASTFPWTNRKTKSVILKHYSIDVEVEEVYFVEKVYILDEPSLIVFQFGFERTLDRN